MTRFEARYRNLETQAVHAGGPRPRVDGAVVTPIFQTANYLMAEESSYQEVRYIRLHNSPNHRLLHARLAALETGDAALATASGMSAITGAILSLVGTGDHLLVHRNVYGGTQNFIDEDLPRLGIETTAFDATREDGWDELVRPETRLVYVEAISNPLLEVPDFEAVVALARRHHLVALIDSTFATPVNLRPLELGFDLVLHSATKYLNGHSDLVAGAVIGAASLVEKITHLQLHLGAALDPHACFLLERGLKTLALRVERQNANALALARFLEAMAPVRRVRYPGLPEDPSHARARRFFRGYGGMLSFYVRDAATAERFLERVRIPAHAASLGGVETLVVRPSRSTHLGMPRDDRERLGITDDLIRLSVGIENIEDLKEDVAQALSS